MSDDKPQFNQKEDVDQLGDALHRAVSSTHREEVDLPEGLLPGDHATMPHHWYSKYTTKLSDFAEQYSAGHRWGNDVVNRSTGEKIWEPMPLYTRIGMHMLFVGHLQDQALEDGYLERLFLKESKEQGGHFDDPKSVAKIPHFINTYKITTEELLVPELGGYKTFNEFFYRKLKSGARPIDDPEESTRIVSPADSRSVFYPTDEVTKYWIKGAEFTVAKLIDDEELAKHYSHIAIFRLAPQDYHRFHSPVDATVGKVKDIIGNLYTVNPMAVHQNLNVFTQNKRAVLELQTDHSQYPVLFVAVGALLVGSIFFTVKEGEKVVKGQELGYFAYGGSTVIVLFPEDMGLEFDQDVVGWSKEGLETLVSVGSGVAKASKVE